MTGTDEPATPATVRWAAEQAVRMHQRGGRCQMCQPDGGCAHLTWALRELARRPS